MIQYINKLTLLFSVLLASQLYSQNDSIKLIIDQKVIEFSQCLSVDKSNIQFERCLEKLKVLEENEILKKPENVVYLKQEISKIMDSLTNKPDMDESLFMDDRFLENFNMNPYEFSENIKIWRKNNHDKSSLNNILTLSQTIEMYNSHQELLKSKTKIENSLIEGGFERSSVMLDSISSIVYTKKLPASHLFRDNPQIIFQNILFVVDKDLICMSATSEEKLDGKFLKLIIAEAFQRIMNR